MKKILMTLAAVLCCATAAMAQMTTEQAYKEAEQKAKEADENPKDGRKQREACETFMDDSVVFANNKYRAQQYAERALAIAKEQPVPQDTLKALACMDLSIIYSRRNDPKTAMKYMGMAVDAFQEEFGSNDPLTIGNKLVYASSMLGINPYRAASLILDAFASSEQVPFSKRIENIDEAYILMEYAIEYLTAAATDRFRYALPAIVYKDKTYLMVQTPFWSMERPVVGWVVPLLTHDDENTQADRNDGVLLYDMETQKIIVLPDEELSYINTNFTCKQSVRNPRQLDIPDNSARLMSFKKQNYNKILETFREFKASLKK